ncbi:hydroxymethylbilane synthase [Calidithermus timidus]|jgi:hydroxymethylbilane synthase|uniref:hydroxymethylbilane synthase n=1 Tax=Calidithermus timidus TaxID=307124 RepID=UPI000377C7C6|nr:hydroxymethylbilane synthase [Calidithermus timidus]
MKLIIGTRASRLALWQSEHIAQRLRELHPGLEVGLLTLSTRGDRELEKALPEIGGKGLFTAELEAALERGEADLAVHSLKDLPTEPDPRFVLGAIPERASPLEALISRSGLRLNELPRGATVGTSSPRRAAQLRAARPDLRVEGLRGNVPTRIQKALDPDGPYDAILLALAGLERLGLQGQVTEILPPEVVLPAPAQGALAVQARAGDEAVLELLRPLDHRPTRRAVEAERAFLRTLGSGCSLPVGALAVEEGGLLRLRGRVLRPDGSQSITHILQGDDPERLGAALAKAVLAQGAAELLEGAWA